MKKSLLTIMPAALLVFGAMDASAGYVPYDGDAAQSSISEYDQNNDSYITTNEVEIELREDAVDKAIAMQKAGKSKKEIAAVIMDMEDSITEDADNIVNKLDKDGDHLVEPEER